MKKRSYKLTFDLKEGYSPKGRVHTLRFAGKLIEAWLTERLKDDKPIVTGFLQDGYLFYPVNNARITANPSAIFSGELSSPDDSKRNTKEVRATLESLALTLKAKLKQEAVYIIYQDENWCV